MNYLFDNFTSTFVIFHNLAYAGRLAQCEFNIVMTLEKGKQIFIHNFTRNNYHIKFIDSHTKIPYRLSILPNIFKTKNIMKEIFPYNCYASKKVFQEGSRVSREIAEVGFDEKPEWIVSQKQQFINNHIMLNLIVSEKYFDMMKYTKFYSTQDVNILNQCYSKFLDNLVLHI